MEPNNENQAGHVFTHNTSLVPPEGIHLMSQSWTRPWKPQANVNQAESSEEWDRYKGSMETSVAERKHFSSCTVCYLQSQGIETNYLGKSVCIWKGFVTDFSLLNHSLIQHLFPQTSSARKAHKNPSSGIINGKATVPVREINVISLCSPTNNDNPTHCQQLPAKKHEI